MQINATNNVNYINSVPKKETAKSEMAFKGNFSKTVEKGSSELDTFVKQGIVNGKEKIKAVKNGNDMIVILSSKDGKNKIFKTDLNKTIQLHSL